MKRSSKQPDFIKLVFAENNQRSNIYDLIYSTKEFKKFKYFRLETPQKEYLIKQGAKYVCESWKFDGTKILHTGLLTTGYTGYYVGDFMEVVKEKKKVSLIIFHTIPENKTFELYFFNHFNKRSVRLKFDFVRGFINGLNLL